MPAQTYHLPISDQGDAESRERDCLRRQAKLSEAQRRIEADLDDLARTHGHVMIRKHWELGRGDPRH